MSLWDHARSPQELFEQCFWYDWRDDTPTVAAAVEAAADMLTFDAKRRTLSLVRTWRDDNAEADWRELLKRFNMNLFVQSSDHGRAIVDEVVEALLRIVREEADGRRGRKPRGGPD